jgi:hypothetical protein
MRAAAAAAVAVEAAAEPAGQLGLAAGARRGAAVA